MENIVPPSTIIPKMVQTQSLQNQLVDMVGGLRSKDMSRGLGPEAYLIKKAAPGQYKVFVKLFNGNGKLMT